MSLSPDRYPAPSESLLPLSLGPQLSQQFAVASEAWRTRGQVFRHCWLAFCRVERKRPECSVRGASLAVWVRKSLGEIRARKVEQVFASSLKGRAVFESHSHRSEPVIKFSRFINHSLGQASRQSGGAPG